MGGGGDESNQGDRSGQQQEHVGRKELQAAGRNSTVWQTGACRAVAQLPFSP